MLEPVIPPKKKKAKKRAKPAVYRDIVWPLYIELKRGRLGWKDIEKVSKIPWRAMAKFASVHDWGEKAEAFIAKSDPQLTPTDNLASILVTGGAAWQRDVDETLRNAREHLKTMRGGKVLQEARNFKALNDVARSNYNLETKEDKQQSAQTINIAVLMQGVESTPIHAEVVEEA